MCFAKMILYEILYSKIYSSNSLHTKFILNPHTDWKTL